MFWGWKERGLSPPLASPSTPRTARGRAASQVVEGLTPGGAKLTLSVAAGYASKSIVGFLIVIDQVLSILKLVRVTVALFFSRCRWTLSSLVGWLQGKNRS